MDALLAFATIARERNMRKAARALNITQPPLSRKIRRLEDRLGIVLFRRRSDGMELTGDGRKVLSLVHPFLGQAAELSKKLAELAKREKACSALGLTTAFEQAVFSPYIKLWAEEFGGSFPVTRKESPKLVKDVARGTLAAALVALPLDTRGLPVWELKHSENLLAAMPECWPGAGNDSIALRQLNGRPMFWFQRKRNPAYFDHMLALFELYGFSPVFIEEPGEHDVLLARISFGEGWALLPESFTALPRAGVRFVRLEENCSLHIRLGFICGERKYLIAGICE